MASAMISSVPATTACSGAQNFRYLSQGARSPGFGLLTLLSSSLLWYLLLPDP